MSTRPADLPDYRNPPIDELAIGVQFPAIENFYDTHVMLYWEKVRNDYPKAENQLRIEGPIESGEAQPVQPLQISFPLSVPSQGRMWFISEHDDYIIQVQNTRFVQNWRKRGTEYPHFEEVWGLFESHYDDFKGVLDENGLAQPATQQVEITYINWVAGLPPSRFLKFGTETSVRAHGMTYDPEDQAFNLRYRLDSNGEVVERLYVQCQPATRPQEPDTKGAALILVYRAANPSGLTAQQVKEYANFGHTTIVNAFTDLTTPDAHKIWGKIV
jgi:uncharacterized protein (TIGR04255 family)